MNKSDLIAFEQEIADAFNAGHIPYPVHLESGNEDALIDIFKMIRRDDWYCGTWRGHLKCLLKMEKTFHEKHRYVNVEQHEQIMQMRENSEGTAKKLSVVPRHEYEGVAENSSDDAGSEKEGQLPELYPRSSETRQTDKRTLPMRGNEGRGTSSGLQQSEAGDLDVSKMPFKSPFDELKAAIFRGESISLCFPEHRVVSSAIVGGIIPIAMGIALGIKRSGGTESVWCFVGDMSALTGDFRVARAYARAHDLPITWVVENNGKSVMTETMDVWGQGEDRFDFIGHDVLTYRYQSSWPHAGAGKRVQF